MTDKQIIIDVCPYQGECSVSGCKRNDDGCFVRQLFEERDRAENRIVELNKTIQAKEQECEELKDKLDYFEKCNKDLDNYIPAFRMGEFGYIKKSEVLTDELEQLKAENEKLTQELYGQEKIINRLIKQTDNQKQTLTEIKEIAEDTKDKFYDAIHMGGLYDRLEQIIRKINEVIDD